MASTDDRSPYRVDLNSPRFRSLTLEERECREDDADPILRQLLGTPERRAEFMLSTHGDEWLRYVLRNKLTQYPLALYLSGTWSRRPHLADVSVFTDRPDAGRQAGAGIPTANRVIVQRRNGCMRR